MENNWNLCYNTEKQACSHEKAMQMILNGECGLFNPKLLECLEESMDLFEKEYRVESIA